MNVTIDDAITFLTNARTKVGGDACLILSLTGSELSDVDINELVVQNEGDNRYVEVRALHEELPGDGPWSILYEADGDVFKATFNTEQEAMDWASKTDEFDIADTRVYLLDDNHNQTELSESDLSVG